MIAKDQRNANVQGILTHCNANILALLYQILWLIVRWEETCKVVFLLFNRVKESEGWERAAGEKQAHFLYLPPLFLSATTIPYPQPVGVNVVFANVDIFI